ncbi:MAG: hypothetical protein AAFQ67_03150 [Pseudomonadota bacterium]
MLFLFNDQVVELEAPEARLIGRWRSLGCGDPACLMAREALDFVSRVWADHVNGGFELENDTLLDLAALVVAKTGANAALFPATGRLDAEPRLTLLPEAILAALAANRDGRGLVDATGVWRSAA